MQRGDTVYYTSKYNYADHVPALVTHVNPDGTATVEYCKNMRGHLLAFGVTADQLTPRFI